MEPCRRWYRRWYWVVEIFDANYAEVEILMDDLLHRLYT